MLVCSVSPVTTRHRNRESGAQADRAAARAGHRMHDVSLLAPLGGWCEENQNMQRRPPRRPPTGAQLVQRLAAHRSKWSVRMLLLCDSA
eukprot:2279287-Prymnesium_polylepis.1